jgi:hypothetical protein
VTAEHDVRQFFPVDYIGNILDMGIEVYSAAHEMRPFADPGQGRRKDLVPRLAETLSDAFVTPAKHRELEGMCSS